MSDNFMPEIVKTIAKRLDSLRIDNNLSLRDLANKSGVSKSQIANIISERKIPNIYTLSCLCNALNITLSDFLDFDESVYRLRGKENIVIKIYREISPMSQDTVIKMLKCMK